MQKPRLTDRTAEALAVASDYLRERSRDNLLDPADFPQVKRAIEYLEDLLRWKRQKDTHL